MKIQWAKINPTVFLIENRFSISVFLLSFLLYARTVFYEVYYNVESTVLTIANYMDFGASLNIFNVIFNPNEFNISPVLYLLYVAEIFVFGFSPVVLHLTTVMLFSLAAVLVFGFLNRFMSHKMAFFSVSIFVVHPFMVEVVAGIEGAGVLLSLIFFILSFNFFFFYKVKYKLLWSGFCFYLSLLSSSYGMFLPILVLFYGYSFTEGFKFKKVLSLFVILPAYMIYTYTLGLYPFSGEYLIKDASLGEYVMTSFSAAIFYAVKFFYPVDLSSFYGVSLVKDFLSADFIMPLQIIVVMVFVSVVSYRYNKAISFSLLLVLCSFIPISHILPQPYFISFAMSLYAVLGFILLVGVVVDLIIKKLDGRYLKLVVVALVMPLIFLYYLTSERALVWKYNVTLLEDSVVNFPNNYMLRYNLGMFYERQGRFYDALMEFEESVRINMRFGMGYYSVARIYALGGDFDMAVKALKWSVANGVNDFNMILEEPAFSKLIKSGEFEEVKIALEKGISH